MINNDVPPKKVANPCDTPSRLAIPGRIPTNASNIAPGKCDPIHDRSNIIRCWLTWLYTRNKTVVSLQVFCHLLRIKYQSCVQESKRNNHNRINNHVTNICMISKISCPSCPPVWKPVKIVGRNMIACAKMIGITPAAFTFNGRNCLAPPNCLLPTICFA